SVTTAASGGARQDARRQHNGAAISSLYHSTWIRPPAFEPSPLAPRRSPEEQARDRDLGFGSVVSRESRERLLNRDGSFNVVRSGLGLLESFAPYHQLLMISWAGFLGLVRLLYLVLNLVFAVAWVMLGL